MDRATLRWWVLAVLLLVALAALLFAFDQRIPRTSPLLDYVDGPRGSGPAPRSHGAASTQPITQPLARSTAKPRRGRCRGFGSASTRPPGESNRALPGGADRPPGSDDPGLTGRLSGRSGTA